VWVRIDDSRDKKKDKGEGGKAHSSVDESERTKRARRRRKRGERVSNCGLKTKGGTKKKEEEKDTGNISSGRPICQHLIAGTPQARATRNRVKNSPKRRAGGKSKGGKEREVRSRVYLIQKHRPQLKLNRSVKRGWGRSRWKLRIKASRSRKKKIFLHRRGNFNERRFRSDVGALGFKKRAATPI